MPQPLAMDPLQTDSANALAPGRSAKPPDQSNFQAALADMKLNPQEQALYQMHLSNLYGPGGVTNPDGSRSSLYQMTVGFGDRSYVIPTVWGGQILPEEQAIERARQYGLDKFPSYGSEQEAEARYQQMHSYMEKDTQLWRGQQ